MLKIMTLHGDNDGRLILDGKYSATSNTPTKNNWWKKTAQYKQEASHAL